MFYYLRINFRSDMLPAHHFDVLSHLLDGIIFCGKGFCLTLIFINEKATKDQFVREPAEHLQQTRYFRDPNQTKLRWLVLNQIHAWSNRYSRVCVRVHCFYGAEVSTADI